MKLKNFVLFIAVAILAFTACQKDEDVPAPAEKVKIFMSAPQKGDGLKSASTVTERIEIQNGDTVNVEDVKDINTLFCAEDLNGFKVYGEWTIHLVETEDHGLENCYLLGEPGNFVQSSLMAVKLTMLGIYQATFIPNEGSQIFFFIKHRGIPGDTGDEMSSDYAFRLEKNVFQQTVTGENQLKKAYTLYLRSYPGEFNFSDGSEFASEEDYQCLIFGDNVATITPSGFGVQAKIIKVKRCKYSDNFVFCTFLAEKINPISGKYQIVFFTGEYGENWMLFPAMFKTTWKRSGYITFNVI